MSLHGAVHTLSRGMALSAVHRGIAFEERSMRLLQDSLSMSLRRVGGKADGGIDLQGWWWLPSDTASHDASPREYRRLRVLAQCKTEAKKMSPKYVREMEGVLHRYCAEQPRNELDQFEEDIKGFHIVGMLISSSPFSKLAALRAHSSPLPFILMHIPEHDHFEDTEDADSVDGALGSIVFNPALGGVNGILRGQCEARWEYPAQSAGGRLGLWWRGTRLHSWVPDAAETSVGKVA